jgi:peptidoglycan-associated lipoprotein
MKTITMLGLTLAATCLVACAGEGRQTAEPQLTSSTTAGWPDLGRGTARFIRIDLGPDNFAECRRVSPKFAFDSASTYAQDRAQLVSLAACLNAPGMRDRTLRLVGRADPRGTTEYNDKLGTRRAAAIKQILIDSGIAEQRIAVASEGENDAKGDTHETSSGYDRRVDVIVEGGTHAP